MSVVAAWNDGLRRVLRAPWIVGGLWLMTVASTLPLALLLRESIIRHLGSSVAADTAASGVNFDWWNEFLAQASGLSQTFVPAILGFAATLKNISTMADATTLPFVVGVVIFSYLLVSMFLMGGVLDRLARDRATGSYGFFSACGMFFFRFLRLGLVAGIVYWLLFRSLHPLLFDTIYTPLTRDLTVERTAFMYQVVLYVVFAAVLMLVNLWFDYAKVRMVVEDRRSAIGALNAALRFIRRHPGAALGLYLLNVLVFLVVLALYAVVAPGAEGGTWVFVAFLVSQIYIVLRIAVRLVFAASQIALFQGRLAHAGYVAAPEPTWPESPAAEAIRPQ